MTQQSYRVPPEGYSFLLVPGRLRLQSTMTGVTRDATIHNTAGSRRQIISTACTVHFQHECAWIDCFSDDWTIRFWRSCRWIAVFNEHNHPMMRPQVYLKEDLIVSVSLD
ncbi:MAG: hypothetical protein J3Q66DRAFT_201668 [Benniella sp.]|nr:MAG: hypothetical protein J3Q66DRAFT_201668 [Benniella sp.]